MTDWFRISRRPGRLSPGRAVLKALPPTVAYLAFAVLLLLALPERAWYIKKQAFIAISLFGVWRYSWQAVHVVRHWIYRRKVFPALRAEADALQAPCPGRIFIMVTSYREDFNITEMVFESIVREVRSIPSKCVVVTSVGSKPEAEFISRIVNGAGSGDDLKLVLMHQSQGKRVAMGHALRAIAREYNDLREWTPDSKHDVVVFMDGDTVLTPGSLSRCLPFFRLHPRMAALTTDNLGLQQDSTTLFHDWYSLKFAQRNHQFYSHSLSKRVLTITGRYSLFRASIVVQEEFIRFVEADYLESWLFGRIRFLMGDDKSTWFYLLKQGYEMMYVPDVRVIAVEARQSHFIKTSLGLMKRWYGNMLRNNLRAVKLGPRPMGWFIWWAVCDQRLTTWTPLVGPAGMIMLSLFVSPFYIVFYFSWIIFTRLILLWIYVLEGFEMRTTHLPLMLYNQWVGAVVKVMTMYNLDKQTWNKKSADNKTSKVGGVGLDGLRHGVKDMLVCLNFALLFILCGLGTGAVSLPAWSDLLSGDALALEQPADPAAATRGVMVRLKIPEGGDAGRAVARALNHSNASRPLRIEIPAGNFTVETPVVIRRGDVVIQGHGRGNTILLSRLTAGQGAAVFHVKGSKGKRVGRLEDASDPLSSVLSVTGWRKGRPAVWIGVDNDEAFLDSINAGIWRKKRPPLRQYIGWVEDFESDFIMLRTPPKIGFPSGSEVYAPDLVTGVVLAGFSLSQEVPGRSRDQVDGRYENSAEEQAVDGVRFEWAGDCSLKDADIVMAGRHPVAFESCKDVVVENILADGAWNKGKGGNGYIRFARSFGCVLKNSVIRNIRHLTFQWSSSGNEVRDCVLETDVNFHGGYSHDNTVRDCVIEPPEGHLWGAVTRMREGGGAWAPPDGSGNRVIPAP